MPLTFDELKRFAESSAAVRLLRGDHWVEDVAFLFFAFRDAGEVAIPESELRTCLTRWQEKVFSDEPERHPGWVPAVRIRHYVEQRYLHKREPAEQPEPTYELTSEVDRLLAWIEDQRRREFVGTEYGLQAILRDLRELSARASGDWQQRLDVLQARRKEIDEEIAAIHRDPTASSTDTRFVVETVQRLERASQDLVGDFALLRERFAELARNITRREGEDGTRRGDVLRLALDGEDALRKTPMGESFHGFWRLVASSQREEFVVMVNAIYATPGLPAEVAGRRGLRTLLDRLSEQGQVVLDANRQLTRQLRRALDQEEIETRRLMSARISELRELLLVPEVMAEVIEGITVDESIALVLPLDRPMFEPPESPVIDTLFKAADPVDLRAAAEQIAQAGLINFSRLADTLRHSLAEPGYGTGVLLSRVVEMHPPREGLLDILGYLHLARLLETDAEVLDHRPFRWRTAGGRELICPDVFFLTLDRIKK